MSDKTTIEWTATEHSDGSFSAGATWNPLIGCSRVSTGCRFCYAERVAHRFSAVPNNIFHGTTRMVNGAPTWNGVVKFNERVLDQPQRWARPRRIFVNSLSDLFHPMVQDVWLDRIFAAMANAPQHTFIALTKRPDRMRAYLATRSFEPSSRQWGSPRSGPPVPLPHLWMGVSAENQETYDARVEDLVNTNLKVRWISFEPLLGAIDPRFNSNAPSERMLRWHRPLKDRLDWMVVGGESGPGARPCNTDHVAQLVDAARCAGLPIFVKQLGARPVDSEGSRIALVDRKGGDVAEWPETLRIRQFPAIEHSLRTEHSAVAGAL